MANQNEESWGDSRGESATPSNSSELQGVVMIPGDEIKAIERSPQATGRRHSRVFLGYGEGHYHEQRSCESKNEQLSDAWRKDLTRGCQS